MLGWRERMGWRRRGTCRLPSVIVEGDLTVEGDTTLAAVSSASLNTSNIVTSDLQTDTMTADDVATFTGGVECNSDLTMGSGFQVFFDPGAVGAPGLAVRTDVDTGIYLPADGALAFVTAAAFRLYLASSGVQVANALFTPANAFLLSGDNTPTAWSGSVTDYAPTGFAMAGILRIDSGGVGRALNSLAGGADGRMIWLANVGANAFNVLHDDGVTGTAANRFLCPNSVTLAIPPNGARLAIYDSTSARWRVVGAVA